MITKLLALAAPYLIYIAAALIGGSLLFAGIQSWRLKHAHAKIETQQQGLAVCAVNLESTATANSEYQRAEALRREATKADEAERKRLIAQSAAATIAGDKTRAKIEADAVKRNAADAKALELPDCAALEELEICHALRNF